MSESVSVVWTDDYSTYDFGPQHPLKPIRVKLMIELARACGLLDRSNVAVIAPRAAERAELETIHTPVYIDAVSDIGHNFRGPFGDYGWEIGTGDNPAFPRMHEASALVAGGALVAADEVWQDRAQHAFVPAGGLHHAMADHASGFCIYNDPALAIRRLLDAGASRVAYIDVDVHHGDGVQAAFYDDARVLTISLHESGYFLFPGTGIADEIGAGDARGTSVNISLPPYTDDDAYRAAFEHVVPPLVQAFAPDALVTQLGCDTHATDPLAHLALTTNTYRWLASTLHALAHEFCGGRWLATGGGGYQIFEVVPRAWTIYLAELAAAALPDDIPVGWAANARASGAKDLPTRFADLPVRLPPGKAEEVMDAARAAARDTARQIFPFYDLPT